jgi:hypothetical protein
VSFDLLGIRTSGEGHEWLYPTIDDDGQVQPESGEGSFRSLEVTGLSLKEELADKSSKRVALLTDLRLSSLVSDRRLIVCCHDWNKGARAWGIGLGATLAGIENLARRVKETRERRGTLLCGHVRTEWLSHIGYLPRRGMKGRGQVRLVYVDGTDGRERRCYLDIGLTRHDDARAVVTAILTTTMRSWREQSTRDAEVAAVLARLDGDPSFSAPEKATFGMCKLPVFRPVRNTSPPSGR